MSRDGVTCCGSTPTGYVIRTLNVAGSITVIELPSEFGTYTRSGMERRRARMPPVAAAYTFTFPRCDDNWDGVRDDRDTDGVVMLDDPAPDGFEPPAEQAARPIVIAIEAARSHTEVRRGVFTAQ